MEENSRERRILILYGSQTGTAQGIAERMVREAKRLHFTTQLSSMDDYDIRNLIRENLVALVCSTTGQGDVPDNMKNFWKFLLRRNLPANSLDTMQYGVLALGDSSYQKFNFSGKRLQRRLDQLGAQQVVPIGLADDQHDLGADAVVDPWLKSFWQKSLNIFPLPPGLEPISFDILMPSKYKLTKLSSDAVDRKDFSNGENCYGPENPFWAPLIRCQRVTSVDHFQDTRSVEFDISTEINFDPGDVCMIQPQNLDENVDRFVQLFSHFDVDAEFDILTRDCDAKLPPACTLQRPLTLRKCARTLFDLQSIPGRYFFELLSHFTNDLQEKEKFVEFTTAEGQQDLYEYCNRPRRNILEVLEDFQLNTVPYIPMEYLFDLFPPIKPRAFSIASSLASVPNRIQLLIAVVNYKSKLVAPRRGLCSTWLTTLTPGYKVPIWIKKGTFQFPSGKPLVLVGPGTGIAPFRSYITHELASAGSHRPVELYFGCRHPDKDFYFREEWTQLDEAFDNFHVRVGFSRVGENCDYVQDVMGRYSEKLFQLIHNENGYFFVAGRAKQMPDQVRQALKDSLVKHGSDVFKDESEVEKYLQTMELQNRYQTETWS